jgi:toxin ParE1/3/4
LVAAVRWIANDNPQAAQALRDAIAQAAGRIGEHPHIGVVRPRFLRQEFRFLVLSSFPYLVIYNAERNPPEIVAIVHSARDLPPLLRNLD